MPRSGTTLVEQILASHPLVFGAGELKTLNDLVNEVRGPDGNARPLSRVRARRLMRVRCGQIGAALPR